MSRQITLFWRLSEHLTAGEFRKRFRSVNGNEPPKLLFWHDDTGQTIRCGHSKSVAQSEVGIEFSEQTEEGKAPVCQGQENLGTQKKEYWKRKRGPKNEKALTNEDRIHDDSMAMIRFFHSKRSVGISFLGSEMIDFANSNLPIILDCAEQALGRTRLEVQDTEVNLTLNSSPSMWVIPTMTLRNPNFEFLKPEAYCERIIKQDILRQAKILGIEVPGGFYVKVTHIADKGSHWVRTGSVASSLGGKTGGALRLTGVEFVTNINFSGYWAAGSLISKGFGRILRMTRTGSLAVGAENE